MRRRSFSSASYAWIKVFVHPFLASVVLGYWSRWKSAQMFRCPNSGFSSICFDACMEDGTRIMSKLSSRRITHSSQRITKQKEKHFFQNENEETMFSFKKTPLCLGSWQPWSCCCFAQSRNLNNDSFHDTQRKFVSFHNKLQCTAIFKQMFSHGFATKRMSNVL